jgi:hypothetical protein
VREGGRKAGKLRSGEKARETLSKRFRSKGEREE